MSVDINNMKYMIYGDGRIAKDFLYIFDNLNIEGYIPESEEDLYGLNQKLKRVQLNEVLSELFDGKMQIIICVSEPKSAERHLESFDLVKGEHFLNAEVFFSLLDQTHIPSDKKIVIWGTGKMCQYLLRECTDISPDLFIDSYRDGTSFHNIRLCRPEQIDNLNDFFVIVAVSRADDIFAYLDEHGMEYEADYMGYQRVLSMPSRMLKKTLYDTHYYDFTCKTMLNHLEILHNGETMCCCSTFLDYNMHNVLDQKNGGMKLWNSAVHKILCLSTENHTYSFCRKDMCPFFIGRESKGSSLKDAPYENMTEYPEVLALGYDATCNLACETCREDFYVAKGEQKEKIEKITEIIKDQFLEKCRFLILAGDGEVFLTRAYRSIYTDDRCKPEYIRLLSNGMLFDEKHWEEFIDGKTSNVMLTVSIDAATKDSYERIRRGGNFDIITKNMEFASSLRKSGALKYFRMNFVVQMSNMDEMISFAEWGRTLGADEVFFTKILNWGTYSAEDFKHISIMEEDGITPKRELVAILDDPRMNDPIVDLGTIRYNHRPVNEKYIYNYYMWELERKVTGLFSELGE